MRRRIVASVEPVGVVCRSTGIGLVDITSEEQMLEAAEEGRMIWALQEDSEELGEILYNGAEWSCEPPKAHEEPAPSGDVLIPSPEYIDAQAEVLQSELEAVAEAVAETLPRARATALTQSIGAARAAIASASPLRMARIAQSLSDTPSASLFSVERAEKMNATA